MPNQTGDKRGATWGQRKAQSAGKAFQLTFLSLL
jgi:hypothetical protein